MSNTSKIKELATRVVRSMSWNHVDRENEIKAVMAEGRIHGLSPNVIAEYAKNHRDELANTIKTNSELTSLSLFNAWWKDNKNLPIEGPEYKQQLHIHVNGLNGQFDYFN